jgi:hypothetical protein
MNLFSNKSERTVENLYLQRFSCTEDGMHLELCIANSEGKLDTNSKPYPIVTIRADEGDQRKFVIYSSDGPISIPLSEIKKAISVAEEEVHSEEFYD